MTMSRLPVVIASSVIRSSQQGESHGGVYLVDLENRTFKQVIDWNDPSISWEGRGWDRGLRGIAFYNGLVYLAASDEIFVYTPEFRRVKSFRNPYLKHCHEICVHDEQLYLTSTGFDSVLEFDLRAEKFLRGFYFDRQGGGDPHLRLYDPGLPNGPPPAVDCHINSVSVVDNALFVSGLKMDVLWRVGEVGLERYGVLPLMTHNARPYRDGILCQDTGSDRVAILDRAGTAIETFPLPRYSVESLTWTELTADRARQAFGRGLCITENGRIVAGSSPSTISVYESGSVAPVASVQLTNDIRNAIHGLEVWPFGH
jgi:hypothetical protein